MNYSATVFHSISIEFPFILLIMLCYYV